MKTYNVTPESAGVYSIKPKQGSVFFELKFATTLALQDLAVEDFWPVLRRPLETTAFLGRNLTKLNPSRDKTRIRSVI